MHRSWKSKSEGKMSRIYRNVAAMGFLAVLLAGCGHGAAVCPAAVIIVDASSLTAFPQGTAPDPSHALYSIHITNVTTRCELDKQTHEIDSSLEVSFAASRAPNGSAFHGKVPYFVVVAGADGKILTRQTVLAEFDFDPGQATTAFKDNIASVIIDPPRDKMPWDYQLLVGLQLTKAQLDYNRTVGPYAQ
jgi:hypothetical protein